MRKIIWYISRLNLGALVKFLYGFKNRNEILQGKSIFQSENSIGGVELQCKGALKIEGVNFEKYADDILGELDWESPAKGNYTDKGFWKLVPSSFEENGVLPSKSALVRFALSRHVLIPVMDYFKCAPLLIDVTVTESKFNNRELSYSQLWHLDYDDPNVVKVFLYLNDVLKIENGPFTFVSKNRSILPRLALYSHISDKVFYILSPKDKVQSFYGAKGFSFACVTSKCFHMGSRVACGETRLMLTATFVKPPRIFPTSRNRFSNQGGLNALESFVLGLRK